MQNLYFIAIIPHVELQEHVKQFKDEIRDMYGAAQALKSPAHITLQMPFRRSWEEEGRISLALSNFSATIQAFNIALSGFGCFAPRVIYIEPKPSENLVDVYRNLQTLLLNHLDFSKQEVGNRFNPHMTIAARDLTPEMFRNAWPTFANRHFEANFQVKNISLLRHNGKSWDIYQEFSTKP